MEVMVFRRYKIEHHWLQMSREVTREQRSAGGKEVM